MKSIAVVLVLLLSTGFMMGHKVVALPEIGNINSLAYPLNVDDDHLYICDGINILIYSTGDYKLKKKFGKAGEGPGEFMGYDGGAYVVAQLSPDYLIVDSIGKLTYFTKEGDYVKEIKTMNGLGFLAFDDKFVGKLTLGEGHTVYTTTNLYDANFKRLKELMKVKTFALQNSINIFEFRQPHPVVYKNKLYMTDFRDGSIAVYDPNGEKLYTIKYDFDKVSVTEAHRQETINSIKNDIRFKQYADQIIPRLSFPQNFPAVKYYHVSDNKIYLLTYAMVKEKSQFVIMDLKGKLINKIYFPLKNVNFYEPYSYMIHKNKLFQLVDNDATETWELYISDFN